jgi:glycosyltransferase involved in cell wall biosynthesis
MKALQYMALGIPAIVSPVGVNTEIIADGANGYLARDHQDWRRAIDALTDPETRSRLGNAARRTIVERYSTHHGANRFAALLESAVCRS